MSRMSSERPPPPEFFLERSLGKLSADGLRNHGWIIHAIHDHFERDAEDVPDAEWIAYGCDRGWVCLTKDKRIRYRAPEIGVLAHGHIFCLADGNLTVVEAVQRFADALPAIVRGVARHDVGFWHVHAGGVVTRMWP